ncbi:MAG: hypothetical protein JO015_14195 [Verrucomicrobia bacterium]|nr:hypothetical protein [Verrucomicrobiota bacterium]
MKVSFLSIGIDVAEAVVEVFASEASPDPERSEGAGVHILASIPRHYRAEVAVVFGSPAARETLAQVQDGNPAGQLPETLSSFLAQSGRLGIKTVLARGALVALPALAVLVVPRIARAALPAAGKSTRLRSWVRGLLPAPPPRLPPSGACTPSRNG